MVATKPPIMLMDVVAGPLTTRVAGLLRMGMKRTADRNGKAVTAQKERSKNPAEVAIHGTTVGQRDNTQRPIS